MFLKRSNLKGRFLNRVDALRSSTFLVQHFTCTLSNKNNLKSKNSSRNIILSFSFLSLDQCKKNRVKQVSRTITISNVYT